MCLIFIMCISSSVVSCRAQAVIKPQYVDHIANMPAYAKFKLGSHLEKKDGERFLLVCLFVCLFVAFFAVFSHGINNTLL